jgi:hypothetical protein
MRKRAVTGSNTVGGVINGSEGRLMLCGEADVDQSSVDEVVAP